MFFKVEFGRGGGWWPEKNKEVHVLMVGVLGFGV